jgi:hypothetical protein
MRIPPANTDRPSNGAIRNSARRFVLEVAAAHGTKRLQRIYQSTSKLKAPLMPVRDFCFFMHAIRPQTPCPRLHFAAIEFPETDGNSSILRE